MKRIFTSAAVAIVMLLAATSAQAQIKFGLKGGLNVTDMSLSKEVFNADNQAGFFIGPTVKFSLPLIGLGIDAAALYDQRQAKVKGEVGYEQIYREERSLDSKYINIPINLRYGIGLGSVASLNFFAGPQFDRVSDFLGPLKISVTQISAGTQHNVVPDLCRIVVDVRTTDAYSNEHTLEMIRAAVHIRRSTFR